DKVLLCSRRFSLFLLQFSLFLFVIEIGRALIDVVKLALDLGFGGGFRGFNLSILPEQKILKLDEDDQLAEGKIAKFRGEFYAAKQRFFKLPDSLKEMPKMNPKGNTFFLGLLFEFIDFKNTFVGIVTHLGEKPPIPALIDRQELAQTHLAH
ncbi:hypothetical protein U1Q18_010675, partial [Sarracenia purpurea var. burkii]